MPTGRVKWFSLEKGFGFIANDEGEDVYLAATSLPEGVATVKPGTKLEFSIADSGDFIDAHAGAGDLYLPVRGGAYCDVFLQDHAGVGRRGDDAVRL